ncbi:3-oxo-5-alpha-steroid 4-dehydrogenase-domain-containing protein [Cokeromyces recurvatus]|uniref:3-oxo-5-alpha-steroid 4-dehydrogenase-domain-containing protein n=1 Tax=Cokeromyces recurvatus TaxID=90255 RepID=UPI00221EA680|nr:3-oxo-5-alpha-steroid 4-dehydrogenase-domain-containing protein [Cokeromyces recurvatus]KAI7904611.1 3-oxo-5-alpha-steroid 4-dehydrogenase-domain-containing protein [Cokeromyces recurvatus]
MYLIIIICSCLITLTLLSICAKKIHELQASVLSYGKLNLHNNRKPITSWAQTLSTLKIPKHYFNHFYVIGLFTALESILEITLWLYFKRSFILIRLLQRYDVNMGSDHVSREQIWIGLVMMTCHLIRRVYESFWIERPSKTATMHLSHYFIGVGFYGGMVLGTWLEGAAQLGLWGEEDSRRGRDEQKQSLHVLTLLIAFGLFLYASYHQSRCHKILASLRKQDREVYSIPRGDWFEFIVAPHYFADILIYLSLNILYHFQNYIFICGLIWTIVNLSITANETQSWYYHHFSREKYHQAFPHGRYRIIPGCY